jgi:Carboxypeptidase regulatory-like domain
MRSVPISTSFVLLFILFSPSVGAQSTGAISGIVTDAATGAPLAGADVIIEGSALSTATDRFTLIGVPVGDQSLLITYLGHREERAGRLQLVSRHRIERNLAEISLGRRDSLAINHHRVQPGLRATNEGRIGLHPDRGRLKHPGCVMRLLLRLDRESCRSGRRRRHS